MDLRQLRYFVAVAEAGHVTRAAEHLGIQQPPLSQQIKLLETRLGVRLFRRHARGVTLTEAGRLLLADAKPIVQNVAALEKHMARVARGEQGTLSLGFTSSVAAHGFAPETLRSCRRDYPGIELVLSEDNAANITEAVAGGRLHCGFIRVPVAKPQNLTFETLLREPVVVAVPVGHRLLGGAGVATGAAAPTLAIADLRDEAFILVRRPGAPGLYENLLELCRAEGFRPRIAAEVERMMTNLNLVAAGAGITVVPASMRGTHAGNIVYCALHEGIQLDAPVTLVYRSSECDGPTALFAALCRKGAASWE